jgi:hypothetical protein
VDIFVDVHTPTRYINSGDLKDEHMMGNAAMTGATYGSDGGQELS